MVFIYGRSHSHQTLFFGPLATATFPICPVLNSFKNHEEREDKSGGFSRAVSEGRTRNSQRISIEGSLQSRLGGKSERKENLRRSPEEKKSFALRADAVRGRERERENGSDCFYPP